MSLPGKVWLYYREVGWEKDVYKRQEYTYQVVVNKKYLTPQQAAEYGQEPAQLEPWDLMGSLA